MAQQWILLFFLFFSGALWGQDERYYRQILSGDLPKMFRGLDESVQHQFNVRGPAYLVDLNGDGIEETLQPQKRDGVDWIEVKDASKRTVFEAGLFAAGANSYLFKAKLVSLSKKVKALVLFLDEGVTQGKGFDSTAKIYLVSWEKDDLSTMKLAAGPHFFVEHRSMRDQYYRRDYLLNVYDTNKDGQKEVIVHFNHIQRIMEYKGNGEWFRY
jgi:hypothetical protein